MDLANLKLLLVEQHATPILRPRSPGAEGNRYGFEGGRAFKQGGVYHLFTSEIVDDPFWVKMRLAHWTSADRLNWKRMSTLYESSGEFEGKDPRAALWSPMPIYNEKEGRWNLFYVAYHSAPNTPERFLNNHLGRIWRAASTVEGETGWGGPYRDIEIVLEPGPDSDAWEGLQGTDSFFPYPVGERWYAFYGSSHTERLPLERWQVGLATAPELSGPWRRCSELNPLTVEPVFIENPVVHRLEEGIYVAVYNNIIPNAIGYTFSSDGIHWAPGQSLIVQPKGTDAWAADVRTPLGLIPEDGEIFTLFYTGSQNPSKQYTDETPFGSGSIAEYYGSCAIGLVTLKLKR